MSVNIDLLSLITFLYPVYHIRLQEDIKTLSKR